MAAALAAAIFVYETRIRNNHRIDRLPMQFCHFDQFGDSFDPEWINSTLRT